MHDYFNKISELSDAKALRSLFSTTLHQAAPAQTALILTMIVPKEPKTGSPTDRAESLMARHLRYFCHATYIYGKQKCNHLLLTLFIYDFYSTDGI